MLVVARPSIQVVLMPPSIEVRVSFKALFNRWSQAASFPA